MMKKILTVCAFIIIASLQATEFDCSKRFWVDAEYLYWNIQNSPKVIPLVIQGTSSSSVLGDADTHVVLGGKNENNQWRSGGRFAVGGWLNQNRCFGLEANYFFLATRSKCHRVRSDGLAGSPFLAAPFFDVTTGHENAIGIACSDCTPEPYSGRASARFSNYMQGAELNGLMTLPQWCRFDTVLLGGFRYWNFDDRLCFFISSPFVPPHCAPNVFRTGDKFHATNNFYGGQIGAKLNYFCGRVYVDLRAKVALGAICQDSRIRGRLRTSDFVACDSKPQRFRGGYFALPTNIGHRSETRFSVIPEGDLNIGYKLTDRFSIQVGYSVIYVTNVLWAAKQISRDLNPTQSVVFENTPDAVLSGQPAPLNCLHSHDLLVHGVNAGIEFRF